MCKKRHVSLWSDGYLCRGIINENFNERKVFVCKKCVLTDRARIDNAQNNVKFTPHSTTAQYIKLSNGHALIITFIFVVKGWIIEVVCSRLK